VITALLQHAFPGGEKVPSARPAGLGLGLGRCREAPPIAAGRCHSLFVDVAGRLLACGQGHAAGHGHAYTEYLRPEPVAVVTGVSVLSVAAGAPHSLALSSDCQVYSWGKNDYGQLGHRDELDRTSPVPTEGLKDVHDIAASARQSLAVTQSGDVLRWGAALQSVARKELRPIRGCFGG
jgi:alpha-tubulin suppressor-like RCC1 family protein